MRALEKALRIKTFWQPIGIAELFEAADFVDTVDHSECASEVEDEDKGSIFNETASMRKISKIKIPHFSKVTKFRKMCPIHSISKNSWTGRTMQSPRSSGSQSPYHHLPNESDSDTTKAILADVGPGLAENVLGRVPSPQVMLHNNSADELDDKDVKNSSLNLPGPTEKRLSLDPPVSTSPSKKYKSNENDDMDTVEDQKTLDLKDKMEDVSNSTQKLDVKENGDGTNND